jgi:two-component system NarL family sensor kinase
LSPEIELTVFRLVQECLTNIHRHSGSKTATIKIVRQDERIDVEVQDRGRAIPQERLADIQMHGGGVGIRGMRERLRHFRGELDIESNTLGTTVHATLPLDSNHSH